MVFQNYALYPHLSVFDNLAFPLKMRKQNKNTIHESVVQTAKLLGVGNYLQKKPKELSGGERQRVALGRAIIRKPKIFLMDEPLSNLDAKLRTQMRGELLKLHKALSATIIYVTHDQIEALTMGSKIAVLNKGALQQVGTPEEVYNTPSNIFVAGFIGNPGMNFFEFTISDDHSFFLLNQNLGLVQNEKFKAKAKQNKLLNKKLILGIRPEHLKVDQGGDISFYAKVDFLEMLGNEFLLYAKFSESNSDVNFSIKMIDNCPFKIGDKVKVHIDLGKVHIFDPETSMRINI